MGKCRYCKFLLPFVAGIIAGLVGQFFYELFGKPVLPTYPPDWVEPEEYINNAIGWRQEYDPPEKFYPKSRGTIAARPELFPGLEIELLGVYDNAVYDASLDDTQPIRVERPDPWNELGFDCGEPWGKPTGKRDGWRDISDWDKRK